MKKLLLTLLTITLIFAAAIAVNADVNSLTPEVHATEIIESGTCGDNVTWELDDEGTFVISGSGIMSSAPEILDRNSIKKIVISSEITSIHEYSFFECINVESIIFEENSKVEIIGEAAFKSCASLSSVSIPASVVKIDTYAFANCSKLASVTFINESKLERIEHFAFDFCYSLDEILIPETVTYLGMCFYNCTSLKSIFIPANVTEIRGAFWGCTALENVTFAEDSKLTLIGSRTFSGCTSLKEISVPATVIVIESNAFAESSNITKVIIPQNSELQEIEEAAFDYCSSLEEINIPDSVIFIGQAAFRCCTALSKINISENSKLSYIERIAFGACDSLKTVYVPASVVTVEDGIFVGCTRLTEIVVDKNNPNYVSIDGVMYTRDGKTLVQYPAGKTSAVYCIPASVEFVGEGAFGLCNYIADIIFEENSKLKKIGINAFSEAGNLQTIEIPASTEIVSSDAFYDCTKLSDVYYASTEDAWNLITIYGGNKCLKNANIHYSSTNDNLETDENPEADAEQKNECSHICHKEGFLGFIWKIINFFGKLFGMNPVCECGAAHY